MTTIGRNIKRRRERQGWSQAELAGKVGIHRTSLARLEAGGKGPRSRRRAARHPSPLIQRDVPTR